MDRTSRAMPDTLVFSEIQFVIMTHTSPINKYKWGEGEVWASHILINLQSPLPRGKVIFSLFRLQAIFICLVYEIRAIHHSVARGPCDRSCGEEGSVKDKLWAFQANTSPSLFHAKRHETSCADSGPISRTSVSSSSRGAFWFLSLPLAVRAFYFIIYRNIAACDYAESACPVLLVSPGSYGGSSSRMMCLVEHLLMSNNFFFLFEKCLF